MPLKLAAAVFALPVAALLAVGQPEKAPTKQVVIEAKTMPAVQFVGQDSKIESAKYVLVTNVEDWNKLWAEHTGVAQSYSPPRYTAPIIDFTRYVVVGAFNGKSTNTDGKIVDAIRLDPDAVRVRFHTASFQTARSGPGDDPGTATSSYGLWVIEKSTKPIVLEEPAQTTKAGSSGWKEVQRFEIK